MIIKGKVVLQLILFTGLCNPVLNEVCQTPLDVVFLVENSNFILSTDWVFERQFINNIIDQFDSDSTRFAIVTFNDLGRVDLFLGGSHDREYLRRHVNSMQLVQGHCNVAPGLKTVREQVLVEEAGDRPNIPNVVVVIMNGWPTQESSIPLIPQEAALLKTKAKIVTIGVGNFIKEEHMNMLDPDGTLKTGFVNISTDTAKDAAAVICAAVSDFNPREQVLSDQPRNPDEIPPVAYDLSYTTCRPSTDTVYRFNITRLQDGSTIPLGSIYRFTVVLIVNVATYDDFTSESYRDLNALIRRVETDDDTHLFAVLAIPSNNIGRAEPGNNDEILNGLRCVRPGNNYEPLSRFHLTQKYDVNGRNEHPLYTYLKANCDAPSDLLPDRMDINYSPQKRNDILANFEKILVGKNGIPYRRYNARYPTNEIYNDTMFLLRQTIP